MQRFTNILFINDPPLHAKPALQRAIKLARENKAKLTIASIIVDLPKNMGQLEKTFWELQDKQLQTLLDELSTTDINIETCHLKGIPFLQILKEVTDKDYDLIIKPSEGNDGISSMLFGSTDLHLLRNCPCPVWIIKPTKQRKLARILAAVDPDPGEKANAELNALILDLSIALATEEKSELHIVHSWEMVYEDILRSGHAHISQSEVDLLVHEIHSRHKAWLDDLLGPYDFEGLSLKVHLVKGHPGEMIPHIAQTEEIELIVMGTVARTGIPGFFIGNTAEKTIARVDCSVLAVKPKAFSTPVKG